MNPAVAYGGAILVLIVAYVACYGMLGAYRGSFGPLVTWLADQFDKVAIPTGFHRVHLLGPIASALRRIDRAIDNGLTWAVTHSEGGIVFLWHGLAQQMRWLGQHLAAFAETVERNLKWISIAFPPAAILWAGVKLAQQIPALWRAIVRAEHRIAHTTTTVVKQAASVTNVTKNYVTRTVYKTVAAVAGVVAAPLPWVRGRLGGISHDLAGIRARLSKLERVGVGAGIAAAVGVALARLGLGWLRCPRVAKAGKQACGMDAGLLDVLLAETLLIAGTVSLIEFAREMQSVTGEATPLIARFWRAV